MLRNRNIAFTIENQTYSIPAHSTVENHKDILQVRYTFNKTIIPLDTSYVTVYKEFETVIMITDRGNHFSSGPLYDQLLSWYNEMFNTWID